MKKKLLLLIVVFSSLFAIVFLYRKIDSGAFEKELRPAYENVQNSWSGTVGPLMASQWRQDSAFAEFTPGHELLGCWSVAFAQVLSFYRLQPSGNVSYKTTMGTSVNQELAEVDYSKVVPFISVNTPSECVSETAQFCYQVALTVRKDFGTGEYRDISVIPGEVSEHFSCSVTRHDSDLLKVICSELDSGHPVVAYFNDILGIKIVRNGHAAVFDGKVKINGELFVHVNFGWGGKSDGWYHFSRLSHERKLEYIFSINPPET